MFEPKTGRVKEEMKGGNRDQGKTKNPQVVPDGYGNADLSQLRLLEYEIMQPIPNLFE